MSLTEEKSKKKKKSKCRSEENFKYGRLITKEEGRWSNSTKQLEV